MIPHERSLVRRLSREPFALLGINVDDDRTAVAKFLTDNEVTWPVWWSSGFEGPIAKQWHVSSYPTIYVLDERGTIRFKNVRGKELDAAVEELLAETKRARSR